MQQKNENISVPGKQSHFSGLLGPVITEMGISFSLKIFFPDFQKRFSICGHLIRFLPTVSAVVIE